MCQLKRFRNTDGDAIAHQDSVQNTHALNKTQNATQAMNSLTYIQLCENTHHDMLSVAATMPPQEYREARTLIDHLLETGASLNEARAALQMEATLHPANHRAVA
jgi:predicted translin family RNA/ssDNA-binding protein